MQMKRIVMLAAAAFVIFMQSGCSKPKSSQEQSSAVSSEVSTEPSSAPASELPLLRDSKLSEVIRSELAGSGWIVRDVSADHLGIFEQTPPLALYTAKNAQDQLIFLSWFESEEQAAASYSALVPEGSSAAIENGGNYQQAVVTLPQGGGVWIFRQLGGNVFGAWTLDSSNVQSLTALLDSFQNPA